MAGDYYISSKENPANRAKVEPSFLSQIVNALVSFVKDTKDAVVGIKWQDRGSAEPRTTDILRLNSQSTVPAAQSPLAENSELARSHQNNEPQFRFVQIGEHHNQPVPLAATRAEGGPHFVPSKERFHNFSDLIRSRTTGPDAARPGARLGTRVDAKKIIQDTQVTPAGSGSGGSGGGGGGGGGGGSSGGFSGGGRTGISR